MRTADHGLEADHLEWTNTVNYLLLHHPHSGSRIRRIANSRKPIHQGTRMGFLGVGIGEREQEAELGNHHSRHPRVAPYNLPLHPTNPTCITWSVEAGHCRVMNVYLVTARNPPLYVLPRRLSSGMPKAKEIFEEGCFEFRFLKHTGSIETAVDAAYLA